MMRGQAVRFLQWQVVDRMGPRLLVMWLISAVLCLPLHFAVKENPPPPEAVRQLMQSLYFQLGSLAVVVFYSGIVHEDRTKGFYRFYLAKPVSPLWFYGQSAVLALLGMLVYTAGFLAMFSWAVQPAWHWSAMTSAVALGLLIGGIIFALSTVTTLDWMWMVAITIFASYLRSRFPAAESTLGRTLNAALPPNQLVDEWHLTASQWAWVGGWALAMYVIGLLILRFRPLGED